MQKASHTKLKKFLEKSKINIESKSKRIFVSSKKYISISEFKSVKINENKQTLKISLIKKVKKTKKISSCFNYIYLKFYI